MKVINRKFLFLSNNKKLSNNKTILLSNESNEFQFIFKYYKLISQFSSFSCLLFFNNFETVKLKYFDVIKTDK